MGQTDTARHILKNLELAWEKRQVLPDAMCALLVGLRKYDRCIDIVEESLLEVRSPKRERLDGHGRPAATRGAETIQRINIIYMDRLYEPVRSHPRFVGLLGEHGLIK
jgi:hypothetical protein